MSIPTVLNLIITGIPSILITNNGTYKMSSVLNLIITGIPSILNILKNSGWAYFQEF